MERILVGMDPERTSRWAGVYALNLAKRIQAKVSFLLVIDPAAKRSTTAISKTAETIAKQRLESLIEEGLSEGILVDYYISYGQYEKRTRQFYKGKSNQHPGGGFTRRPEDFRRKFQKLFGKDQAQGRLPHRSRP